MGTIRYGVSEEVATGAFQGEPDTLEGDIQYPSGDFLYRALIVRLTASLHPTFELDEGESLVRIISDSNISTFVNADDFSRIAGTSRYVATSIRGGAVAFSRLSSRVDVQVQFSVRTSAGGAVDTPAAQVAYTTRPAVEQILPQGLPGRIDGGYFARWIENAGREIDAEVGGEFAVQSSGWKFASVPDTPPIIALIAQWLAASFAFSEIREINRGARDERGSEEIYRARALEKLARIRRGEIEVESATGEDLATSPSPITTLAPTPQFAGIPLSYF